MRRSLIAAVVLAVTLSTGVTACGSSKSSGSASAASKCTLKTARDLKEDFITASKFDVDCVKTAKGNQFYFVNHDDAAHTVTTQSGAPDSFDASLDQKDSTYAHVFNIPGTYEVKCKNHGEEMTLIVY